MLEIQGLGYEMPYGTSHRRNELVKVAEAMTEAIDGVRRGDGLHISKWNISLRKRTLNVWCSAIPSCKDEVEEYGVQIDPITAKFQHSIQKAPTKEPNRANIRNRRTQNNR
jgi:hypothetical protein